MTHRLDWSFHDDYPEVDCFCECGAVFRSHAQVQRKGARRDRPFASTGQGFEIICRTPCPRCSASHRVIRCGGDPADFDIRKR